MAESGKSADKRSRKRILNVIYFVDSARTRSFRLPIERVHALLSLLILGLVWALASVWVVYTLVERERRLGQELSRAKATIFEYESRYEGVYELAYPTERERLTTDVAVGDASDSPSSEEISITDDEPGEILAKTDQAAAKSAAKPATEPPPAAAADSVASAPKPGAADLPGPNQSAAEKVRVADPSIDPLKDSIKLRFRIENDTSPERAEGYIWAVARFQPTQGDPVLIPSPELAKVGPDGNPVQPTKAYRYSIRYYKTEEITFKPPTGISGRFTNIRIGLSDSMGDAIETYNVPVDIAMSGEVAPVSTPAPAKTEVPVETPADAPSGTNAGEVSPSDASGSAEAVNSSSYLADGGNPAERSFETSAGEVDNR